LVKAGRSAMFRVGYSTQPQHYTKWPPIGKDC
jgi:hypothetical protein